MSQVARKLRCPGDKRGLSRETKGYLRISPCSGLGLEQREVGWSQLCWAVGGWGWGYLVVDQMFESNCKPVGGAKECLAGLQLPQCETV